MRALFVIVGAPGFDDIACFLQRCERAFVQAFIAELPLKLSMKAFCVGFPGAM